MVAALSLLPLTLEAVVEAIGYSLGRLAMQAIEAFAVHLLGPTLREPIALATGEAPVPFCYGRPQVPRSPRKAVELVCFAQFELASQIHTLD